MAEIKKNAGSLIASVDMKVLYQQTLKTVSVRSSWRHKCNLLYSARKMNLKIVLFQENNIPPKLGSKTVNNKIILFKSYLKCSYGCEVLGSLRMFLYHTKTSGHFNQPDIFTFYRQNPRDRANLEFLFFLATGLSVA